MNIDIVGLLVILIVSLTGILIIVGVVRGIIGKTLKTEQSYKIPNPYATWEDLAQQLGLKYCLQINGLPYIEGVYNGFPIRAELFHYQEFRSGKKTKARIIVFLAEKHSVSFHLCGFDNVENFQDIARTTTNYRTNDKAFDSKIYTMTNNPQIMPYILTPEIRNSIIQCQTKINLYLIDEKLTFTQEDLLNENRKLQKLLHTMTLISHNLKKLHAK